MTAQVYLFTPPDLGIDIFVGPEPALEEAIGIPPAQTLVHALSILGLRIIPEGEGGRDSVGGEGDLLLHGGPALHIERPLREPQEHGADRGVILERRVDARMPAERLPSHIRLEVAVAHPLAAGLGQGTVHGHRDRGLVRQPGRRAGHHLDRMLAIGLLCRIPLPLEGGGLVRAQKRSIGVELHCRHSGADAGYDGHQAPQSSALLGGQDLDVGWEFLHPRQDPGADLGQQPVGPVARAGGGQHVAMAHDGGEDVVYEEDLLQGVDEILVALPGSEFHQAGLGRLGHVHLLVGPQQSQADAPVVVAQGMAPHDDLTL